MSTLLILCLGLSQCVDTITITSPGNGTTVGLIFDCAGSTSAANTPVTVTLNIPGQAPRVLTATSDANKNWSVRFQNCPPATGCSITAKWTNSPAVAGNVGSITISSVVAPPGGGMGG